MPDLADLFPGFASHWIDTSAGKMFARAGGSGPPLLCLHGYPQTHVMWHRVASALARHFTLVLPDLPGLRLVRRAGGETGSRALHQTRHGQRHDRDHGSARSPTLWPGRT